MLKLYEIERHYLDALDLFTDPDQDLPPEVVADTLEAITGEFEQKAIQVAAFARQMEAEAEAIKAAEARMDRRRQALESRARWLREYVKSGMEVVGVKKVSSPWFVLAVQNNPVAVAIIDPAAVPDAFLRQPEPPPPAPDKTAIKAAWASGTPVPGTRLVTGTRLSIR